MPNVLDNLAPPGMGNKLDSLPPPNPNQPFSEKYPQLGAVVGAAGDFAQSAGSSAFESIMGAYKLIRMVPGVGDRLPPPSEFTEALTHGPDTIAGHAGKMVESMGEFMIPAGKVEQMQKGASLIARMAGQGGAAGVVRMIQSGGDVGSSLDTAAMGAAGPVIGGVIGAMTPKAVELAKAAGMKIGLSVAGRLTGLPIKGIHDLIVSGAGIAPEVAAAIGKDAELLDGIAQGYGYKSFAKVPESGQQLIRNQATAIANSIAGEAAPVAAAPAAVPPAGVTPSGPVRPPVATAAQMMREAETFRPPETFVPGGPLRPPVRPAPASAATPAAAAAPAEMPALEQITEWLINRDGGTASRFTDPVVSEAPITKQTLGDIMDRLMKNRKVPAEVPAATVPAEVPPAAVETPQPATPAPSAAGKPVTAATLMEEVAKPAAQVNNPNYDWRAPEGITAEFKQYLKDSGFDVVPDRPEFDPTNPKAQGKFGGGAKTQVNMDAKANRFVEYLKANKMEPTPNNVARATETLGEADHPSAHTLEKIYTQMGYDALDVEMLARSLAKAESPAASAAAKPPVAPEVPKAAAKPRLDHGELNLPLDKRGGGSINSQLDRYKADLAKAEKAAAKEAAGIRKSDKAIARDLFTQHAQALAESTAAKRGIPVSDSIKLMDSMAKWEPKKLIKLLEKYQADNPKSTTVGELMEKAKVKK